MKLVTYEQVEERFHCSKKTLQRAVKAGEVDAYRPGKRVLLDEATVMSWVMSKKIRPVRSPGSRRTPPVVNLR